MSKPATKPAGEAEQNDRPPAYSDEALALGFTKKHKENLRYVEVWGCWKYWSGIKWKKDDTLLVHDLARRSCRETAVEILQNTNDKTKQRLAASISRASTSANIEKLARADRDHAADTEQWDANPMILNTPGGTLNLRTGEVEPHVRQAYCTKVTAVSPGGECPIWDEFLKRVFSNDEGLIQYVQRVVGYSLTGSIDEHAMFFMYGTGGNGKGVFLNTLQGIMGDYSVSAPMETFTASRHERHPTELAMLRGARIVMAQETEEGQRWAEAKIKALTGGDRISARFMREDFFTFAPQFKLMIAGNHRPGLRNVDEAIRRRLHLIPFTVTIPQKERDIGLTEKLKAEWPGILAWAIKGCLEWQKIGLVPPKVIQEATDQYLAEEDVLGQFLNECCDCSNANALTELGDIYSWFKEWCEKSGEFQVSQKRLSQMFVERGFTRIPHPGTRRSAFRGVRRSDMM